MNTKQSQATELQGLFLETSFSSRGPVLNPSKTVPPAGGQEFTPMHQRRAVFCNQTTINVQAKYHETEDT